MWDVFDPKDGTPIHTTRLGWYAALLAWLYNCDYARTNEGWVDTQ